MPPEITEKESATEDEAQHDDAGSDVESVPEDVSGLKSALAKTREARKLAASEAAGAREERDALLKEKAEREDAAAKEREAEAEKKGEFEALAKKRENERDAAKSDVTRLTAENDQLRAAISGVLDSEWKELPAEVKDAYLGADDDPLARLAFLPKGKALAIKLGERADAARGNGRDPKSSGDGRPSLADERKALIARGGYGL